MCWEWCLFWGRGTEQGVKGKSKVQAARVEGMEEGGVKGGLFVFGIRIRISLNTGLSVFVLIFEYL